MMSVRASKTPVSSQGPSARGANPYAAKSASVMTPTPNASARRKAMPSMPSRPWSSCKPAICIVPRSTPTGSNAAPPNAPARVTSPVNQARANSKLPTSVRDSSTSNSNRLRGMW